MIHWAYTQDTPTIKVGTLPKERVWQLKAIDNEY